MLTLGLDEFACRDQSWPSRTGGPRVYPFGMALRTGIDEKHPVQSALQQFNHTHRLRLITAQGLAGRHAFPSRW